MNLPEEFLLLSLDDEKGILGGWADYGLAAAVLIELEQRGRIGLDQDRMVVCDGSAIEDEVLCRVRGAIAECEKGRTLLDWVSHFGARSEGRQALLQRLVAAGILREEQRRFLRVFPYKRYPTQQTGPEHEIVERIRAVLLSQVEPDARTRALIGLLQTCQVMGAVLHGDEHKAAKARLAELSGPGAAADPFAAAATQAIVALQTACAMTMTAGVP